MLSPGHPINPNPSLSRQAQGSSQEAAQQVLDPVVGLKNRRAAMAQHCHQVVKFQILTNQHQHTKSYQIIPNQTKSYQHAQRRSETGLTSWLCSDVTRLSFHRPVGIFHRSLCLEGRRLVPRCFWRRRRSDPTENSGERRFSFAV